MSVRMLTVRCGRALPLAVLCRDPARASDRESNPGPRRDELREPRVAGAPEHDDHLGSRPSPRAASRSPARAAAAAGATRRARCPRSAASRRR